MLGVEVCRHAVYPHDNSTYVCDRMYVLYMGEPHSCFCDCVHAKRRVCDDAAYIRACLHIDLLEYANALP